MRRSRTETEVALQPLLKGALHTETVLHTKTVLHTDNQNNYGIIGDGSNNVVNSGNVIIEMLDMEDEMDRLLGHHVSKDALRNSFHSHRECHPKTRMTIRNEIGEWIDESESMKSPLLWLNGPAAVGKSVIVKTISQTFHDQIVATFFFSTSADKSAATLFPTLAWQLARSIPDTREHIIASMKSSGALESSEIEEQFDLLIIQPLKKSAVTLKSRPIMMIDGIDECTDESMLVRFLRILVQAGESGDIPVRFVICSRPEARIRAILGRTQDFKPTTHGEEPSVVSESTKSNALIVSSVLIVGIVIVAGLAVISSIALIAYSSPSEATLLMPLTVLLAMLVLPSSVLFIVSYLPKRKTSGHPARGRRFLQGVWALYKPIKLRADKGSDAPLSATSDEDGDGAPQVAETLDRICSHSVISTIMIGNSEESRDDIARYLTDQFNAIRKPVENESPWFKPSDISRLVKASGGQFLYASTIVRLLNDPHFDTGDIFDMERHGSLPTPDMDELYKTILKKAQDNIRNGRSYRKEWQTVKDCLAILVFLSGNVQFFALRHNYPVIETLLGLQRGKLTLKLSNMHSVLRIVHGETIQVHNRSFLEFLQNQERAGEYHIGFSYGLRRILFLMTRAGFKFHTIRISRRSELECIQDMVTECHHNFFEQFRFPYILKVFHLSLHFSLIFAIYMWSFLPLSKFLSVLILFVSPTFFFIIFTGSYAISTMFYTSFFNHSIIVPFFHPFLHPFFHFLGGFLFPWRVLFFMIIIMPIVSLLIPILGGAIYVTN